MPRDETSAAGVIDAITLELQRLAVNPAVDQQGLTEFVGASLHHSVLSVSPVGGSPRLLPGHNLHNLLWQLRQEAADDVPTLLGRARSALDRGDHDEAARWERVALWRLVYLSARGDSARAETGMLMRWSLDGGVALTSASQRTIEDESSFVKPNVDFSKPLNAVGRLVRDDRNRLYGDDEERGNE